MQKQSPKSESTQKTEQDRLLPLFKQQFSMFKQHYTNRPPIFPTYYIEETYLFPLTVCINLAAWLKPHLSPSFLC